MEDRLNNESVGNSNEHMEEDNMGREVKEVAIDEIIIGAYQRKLRKNQAMKIFRNFKESRMRPIEVSYRSGKYWCWDGQTRLMVYKMLGRKYIPCQVHYGLTYEDDCYNYAEQQDDVAAITSAHKWKALVEAKDPETLGIIKICGDHGYTIMPTRHFGSNISAVETMRFLYRNLDKKWIDDILWLMKTTWKYKDGSTESDIIKGLGLFVQKHYYPEDTRQGYDTNRFIIKRLKDSLAKVSPEQLLQEAGEYGKKKQRSIRVAYALTDFYNSNLAEDSKIRLSQFKM